MPDVRAKATGIRVSPRKVGEVAALIRGRNVEDALVILEHTPRRAAKPLTKLVQSVAANAENNHKLQRKGLAISTLSVGTGFAMKRYRPAAHGRALPYKKMTSNVEIQVTGQAAKTKTKKSSDEKKSNDNKQTTATKSTAAKQTDKEKK